MCLISCIYRLNFLVFTLKDVFIRRSNIQCTGCVSYGSILCNFDDIHNIVKNLAKTDCRSMQLCIVTTIILTLSRGVMILIPIVLILYLVVIPEGSKLRAFLMALCAAVSSVIPVLFFTFGRQKPLEPLAGIALGIIVSLILTVAVEFLFRLRLKVMPRLKLKPLFLVHPAALVLAGILIVISIPKELELEIYNPERERSILFRRVLH